MKHKIFINKYNSIKNEIFECIPEDAKLLKLDRECVLVTLPKSSQKKKRLLNVVKSF